MVEVKKYLATAVAALALALGASGQQRRVIAGLEGDEAYRSLVAREASLVRTADSLSRAVAALRRSLRDADVDSADRAAVSASIVELEGRSFATRSGMADIASQINRIEQEWILQSMRPAGEETPAVGSDSADSTDTTLVAPPVLRGAEFFRQNLNGEQLAELSTAERGERGLPALFEKYRGLHARLWETARMHESADTQTVIDSLRTEFEHTAAEARETDAEAAELWERVFDSKSYIYSLVAEKLGYGDLAGAWAEKLAASGGALAQARASSASEAMADYAVQKPLLLDFEAALARKRGDVAAVDSLALAAADVPSPAEAAELPPVVLADRLLLDWSDVAVGKSPYNAANPIPELRVWPRGVIWRARLGTFSARQQVSIFRGASPLAVDRGEDNKYRYYAGGFRTDSVAAAAVEQLRKAGFRAPVAVVWMDGVLIDPDADKDGERRYRVEISGVDELSAAVRDIVGGAGMVRGADAFIATPLDGASAVRLRAGLEALRPSHPGLEARLVENAE